MGSPVNCGWCREYYDEVTQSAHCPHFPMAGVLKLADDAPPANGPNLTVDELRYIRLHLSWDNDEGEEIVKRVEKKLRPCIPELKAFDDERTTSNATISAQFHKVWTSQVGTEGYDKDQWQKLRTLLAQRGVRV